MHSRFKGDERAKDTEKLEFDTTTVFKNQPKFLNSKITLYLFLVKSTCGSHIKELDTFKTEERYEKSSTSEVIIKTKKDRSQPKDYRRGT